MHLRSRKHFLVTEKSQLYLSGFQQKHTNWTYQLDTHFLHFIDVYSLVPLNDRNIFLRNLLLSMRRYPHCMDIKECTTNPLLSRWHWTPLFHLLSFNVFSSVGQILIPLTLNLPKLPQPHLSQAFQNPLFGSKGTMRGREKLEHHTCNLFANLAAQLNHLCALKTADACASLTQSLGCVSDLAWASSLFYNMIKVDLCCSKEILPTDIPKDILSLLCNWGGYLSTCKLV